MWFILPRGVSALVLAIVVGKRRDFGILEHRPHNVPFVLLERVSYVGWFGFNAGSALAANGLAVHALITTHVSAAAAMFSWLAIENHVTGPPSLLGGSTGLWQVWLQSHLEQVLFQFGVLSVFVLVNAVETPYNIMEA